MSVLCAWLTVKLPVFVSTSSVHCSLAGLASLVAIGWAIKVFSTVLDLPGDVARYVASDSAHRDAVQNLREILDAVAKRAPDANILLMSHSLGSVLASGALSEPPSLAPNRIILLTLGSPLRLMSRVFPRRVKAPTEIASRFEKHGTALHWMNLWRGEDWIGKALCAGGPRFGESALGAGLHPNYWSDERVWMTVSVLLLKPLPEGQTLEAAWKVIPLTSGEKAELHRRTVQVPLQILPACLLALFILESTRTTDVPPWPDHHVLWSRWVVRAASMLTMGQLTISWYLAWSASRQRPSMRQWLWDLRSASARSWMLVGLSVLTGAAVFGLDWLARARLPSSG